MEKKNKMRTNKNSKHHKRTSDFIILTISYFSPSFERCEMERTLMRPSLENCQASSSLHSNEWGTERNNIYLHRTNNEHREMF